MRTSTPLRTLILVLLSFLSFHQISAQTTVSGNVSGTWTKANSPYVIENAVTIPAGQTLTIEPGVVIESPHIHAGIYIAGTLLAQGTAADSIHIQGKENPGYASYSTHGGMIHFQSGSSSSILDYVSIDRMGDASAGSTTVMIDNGTTPTLKNILIKNSERPADMLTWAGGTQNFSMIKAIVELNAGQVSQDMVLAPLGYPESIYRLTGNLPILQGYKLTIKPGVVIEFDNINAGITAQGALIAQGTASDSIRFIGKENTGYASYSTHGGVILIQDNTSVLDYVVVDRMGDVSSGGTAVQIAASGVAIRHSVFRNSESMGIQVNVADITPIISGNRFETTPKPLAIHPGSGSGISGNDGGIVFLQGGTISGSSIWPKPGTGAYYQYELGANITVNAGAALEIKPGAEIRSNSYSDYLFVYGKLVAKGTAADSIRFIGYANPGYTAQSTHGGQINFGNSAIDSELDYVVVDRWGDQQGVGGNAISISSSGLKITHSSIRNSEEKGIFIAESVSPTINGNRFEGNLKSIYSHPGSLSNLGENEGGIVFLSGGAINGTSVWPKLGAGVYYQFENGATVRVNETGTLEIRPGAEIHSNYLSDNLTIAGKLIAKGTAADSVRFIGYSNTAAYSLSTHGGQILFESSATGSELEYVVVDRWGDLQGYPAAISINTTGVKITHSTIRNSEDKAIAIAESVAPVITQNRFESNVKSIVTYPASVSGISDNEAGIVYLQSGNVSGTTVWSQLGNGSYYRFEPGSTINVTETGTLEMKPGVELHSYYMSDKISVSGKLNAKGTATDSIRFIGHSNTAYYVHSTHGGQLEFIASARDSELDFVAIDRWGDLQNNNSAVLIKTSGLTISNSNVRNSEDKAIVIEGSVAPAITANRFSGNVMDIYAHPAGVSGVTDNDSLVVHLTSGTISQNSKWPKPGQGSYYRLGDGAAAEVAENATLDILPGVEVRSYSFSGGLNVNGTLKAKGTAADSIHFLGFQNPNYGPSSHGGRIYFGEKATDSEMEYVSVNRWGDRDAYGPQSGAITINSSGVSIKKSAIRDADGPGIYLENKAITPSITENKLSGSPIGISIPSLTSNPVISGNTIRNTPQPILAAPGSVSSITANDSIVVFLNSGPITQNSKWPKPGNGGFYQFVDGTTTDVAENTTLEIGPGAEVRSYSFTNALNVSGTLKAVGTASDSIRFIGFQNPNYGPSSHGGRIYFAEKATDSEMEYVSISRWGDKDGWGPQSGAITINSSGVSIKKSAIRDADGPGIYLENKAIVPSITENIMSGSPIGISIPSLTSSPVISGNTIRNTPQPILAAPGSVSGITANDSTVVFLNSGAITQHSKWPKPGNGAFYQFVDGTTTDVAENITLEIEPGAEVHSYSFNNALNVSGTLKAIGTASDSIRFIGFQNPNYGPSSHGGRIYFGDKATDSEMEYVSISRWGDKDGFGPSSGAITINSSGVSIKKSAIREADGYAIYNQSGSSKIEDSHIYQNVRGIVSAGGSPLVKGNKIFGNSEYGVFNSAADTLDARYNDWGDESGPNHPTLNPTGLGNPVSDKVKFIPWGNQIVKVDQVITFNPIPDLYLDDTLKLNATTSSELPLVYSLVTVPAGIAVLSGTQVTFPADTGRVTVTVKQAGNEFYNPAEAERTFKVYKRNQTITFAEIPFKVVGDAPFALSATSNSKLDVAFTVISGPATISGSTVTLSTPGTVVIEARQPGNRVYEPATPVQRTFIVYPHTPDLIVQNVASSSTTVSPRDLVTVTWEVGNIGNASSAIGWTERIYIQSGAGENRTFITQIDHNTGAQLNVGQTLSRSQQVQMPDMLYVGDQAVFVVELAPGPTITEAPGTQANNTGIQTNPWSIRKLLIVSLSASQVVEGPSGQLSVTISRTGSLASALPLSLSFSNASRLSFPASLSIPAGHAAVSFNISVPDNNTIEATTNEQLEVTASGYQGASATFAVVDDDQPSLSITGLPSSAMEGQNVTFKVATDLAPSSPLTVYLTSANINRFPLPASVTIPAGALETSVSVVLAQDNNPEIDLDVAITAGAANHKPTSATIRINDDDLPNLELVLASASISEGAGLNATQATLRRTSTTNAIAFTANLSASIPNTLILPGAISLAAGENEKTFTIGVVDNNVVDGQRQVTITASMFVASCNCNTPASTSGSVSSVITINDNDGPSLLLTVAQQTLQEGHANAGLLRVTRNTSTAAALTVNLATSDETEATLPATAVISAGQTYVEVPITTIDDNITDGNQQVYLSATADGFSAGSVWVIVTDQNKPDLQISAVQLSSNEVAAGSIFNYQVSIRNSGYSTATGGILVRGYLSSDNVIDGSDILVSENTLLEAIPAGQVRQLINAAKAPDKQGTYRLLYWVNPTGALIELLANNNVSAPVEFTVLPNYTATANVTQEYFSKGSNVLITGNAVLNNGSPARNADVEIYVITSGIRRTLTAVTDASGNYEVQFAPLAVEAGHYSIGASAPGLGSTAEQDAFDILGVIVNDNIAPRFQLTLNEPATGTIKIQNLSGKALTNFTLAPVTLPGGAALTFETTSIGPFATANLPYQALGSALSTREAYDAIELQASSAEGTIQRNKAYYYCIAPDALIVSDVTSFETSVSQSSRERIVELRLVNKGKGATGRITVGLPNGNWITSVTPKTLTSIASGDTAAVSLKFLAVDEVPFDYPVNSSIGIAAENGNSISIPFTFKKVAESRGSVRLSVTNQFTYYSDGQPKVSGANVRIENYFTGELYREGQTNAEGIFEANDIPEGRHRIIVSKESHKSYNNSIIINPGIQNASTIFLEYQAVTLNWTVVPTSVQDQYEVQLETRFETNVPVPVVTIDMPDVMPRLTAGEQYSFLVTLTNHGLVTAKDVVLNLPANDPEYEFLTNYVTSDLLAQQSIQIPVVMKRRSGGRIAGRSEETGPCQDVAGVNYWYECFLNVIGLSAAKPIKFEGRCEDRPVPGAGGVVWTDEDIMRYINQYTYWANVAAAWANAFQDVFDGGTPPGRCRDCPPGEPFELPTWMTEKKSCEECIVSVIGALSQCLGLPLEGRPELANSIFGAAACGYGAYLGDGGPKEYFTCLLEGVTGNGSFQELGWTFAKRLPIIGQILCLKNIIVSLSICSRVDTGGGGFSPLKSAADPMAAALQEILDNLTVVHDSFNVRINWATEYFQDIYESNDWSAFYPLVRDNVTNLTPISTTNENNIVAQMAGYELRPDQIRNFVQRWNLSLQARDQDILEPNQQYPGIINWLRVKTYSDSLVDAHNYSIDKNFKTVVDMHETGIESLNQIIDQQQNSVCASVGMQFSQQVAFTREAFEGTLEIFNGHPTDAMKTISVNLLITDANGTPSNGLFEIQTRSLTGLSDVTGNGEINAGQKGSVKFLFIPELGAAPQASKVYKFGGSITYWDPYANAEVTLPLSAVPITVNPSPNLMLHYFMQRNILGDDALTSPEIEPSVPAELAVMVENKGYGPAVNMTISSAQPTIVDNEKGLAINFNLIGSNFQGQPKQLGVTNINFGTVPALQTRIGQWYFTSSLLGKFIAYDAKVVHSNSFGNPDLSLVQGVKLHELTKSIRLYGALDDGINDFLVNDIFDVNDQPDIIYFSQGNRTAKVNPAASANFNAPVSGPSFTNTLTVMPSDTGFNYIKLDDPGNRAYELASLTRSDGQAIPLDNAWLTFVTLPVSQSPVYENKFHIVDHFAATGAATYTVVWKPANVDIPKIDSISGVPASVSGVQVSKLRVHFNKAIDPATFTHDDLTLTLQGGANIINSSVTVTPIDAKTFEVDLTAVTTGSGFFNFTAQAAQIEDIFGTPGQTGKSVTWSQYLEVPIVEAFQGIPANRKAAAFITIQLRFNLPIDASTLLPERFGIYQNNTLLPGSLSVQSVSSDRKLVTLAGLQGIITQAGTYELRVDMPEIKSEGQVPGAVVQSVTLVLDNVGPTVALFEKSYEGGLDAQHVPFVHIRFNEGVVGLNTSAFRLTRNGENIPLAIDQLAYVDAKNWTAGNFGVLTYPEGDYVFSADLTKVVDSTSNAGTGSQQLTWTVNRASAIAVTDLAIGPDLGHSDTDGITSGTSLMVAYHLSVNASQVVISQIDPSGEVVLLNIPNVGAGDRTATVTLAGGGQTRIKVTATAASGGTAATEKAVFVDQLPLFAQWKFAANQQLASQTASVPLAFSARLLSATGLLAAIELRRNGAIVPATGLGLQVVNDTLYNVTGLSTVSPSAGNYKLTIDIQGLAKYSSGKANAGTASASWTVLSANRAPVANAGPDVAVTAPGTVQLNASTSSDPDGDPITYSWVAPDGITLTNASGVSPTLTLTEGNRNKVYSILLIVSDGVLFSTDVVLVSFNSEVSFSGLADKFCFNAAPVILAGSPAGGVFSGPGIAGNSFDPAAAGIGNHTITYTYSGQVFSQTTIVYAAPELGRDTVLTVICENEKIDLVAMFNQEGLTAVWNTETPENAGIGTYQLIATNALGCSDTLTVTVSQTFSTWTGAVSSDWETPGNWNNGQLPTWQSHVVVPAETQRCDIKNDIEIATITLQKGSNVKIEPGVHVTLTAQCMP